MNSKWIQWSVTVFSAAAFGLALVLSGCGGGGGGSSAVEPEKPKEFKKSTEDKSSKESFKSQGMPKVDPKLEEQLKNDVE